MSFSHVGNRGLGSAVDNLGVPTDVVATQTSFWLNKALTQAQSVLYKTALSPKLSNYLETAFGSGYDADAANDIVSQWKSKDFSQLPTVMVLSPEAMNGAQGAYSAANNTIYLSSALLVKGLVTAARDVLLEEFGHYLDAQVNAQDAAGDEGEIWQNLVLNRRLSRAQLETLRSEKDLGTVMVNGEVVQVERSLITLTVNTEFDENDGLSNSGEGLSLRDAIIIANGDINNDYTINLASGKTYFLTQGLAGENNGLAGDLDIKNGANITIRTNGSTPATINASTILNGGDRVFHVLSGGALTLDGVVVTGGSGGGGIFNDSGILNVFRSTISGNSAIFGGGIFTRFGTAQIISSTINSNLSSVDGGGIFNDGTNLTISNSTISGNSSNSNGGGIRASGNTLKTLLVNTTVTNNTADADNNSNGNGGGIFSIGSSVGLRNTIVAGNFDTPNNNGSSTKNPDITGSIQGNANNLIGNLTGASGTIGTGSDIVLAVGQSAGLGTLANNGGITRTHALLAGSPAINAGLMALIGTDLSDSDGDGNVTEVVPTDQRGSGFVRVSGSNVDIGAFEVQGIVTLPSITLAVSPASVTEDGTTNLVYTFTRTGATTSALTVNYGITGTANATDYTGATPGTGKTITFATGSSTTALTINPTTDTTVEPNETVLLTLATGAGYTVGTTAAITGTITNDDTSANPGITLVGDNDDDYLLGGPKNDILKGLGGNDVLNGGPGTDTFEGGPGNDSYFVDNSGDVVSETTGGSAGGTDSVYASLTYTLPNNVENLILLNTGNANDNFNATGNTLDNKLGGNSGKNVLTGLGGNDSLNGKSGNDSLNGGTGQDALTGGTGSDNFIFQFSQSTLAAPDRITDFTIGADKIDLLTKAGAATAAPTSFSRAANSNLATLANVVNQVFTDANGSTAGAQALGVNQAALVTLTTAGIAGTYLIINDNTAGFQSANDLLVNVTGFSGTLPGLGAIAVNSFFV